MANRTPAVDGAERGRLTTRAPGSAPTVAQPLEAGTREVALGRSGRAWVRVPHGAGGRPLPLVVALHGAGGRANGMLAMLAGAADREGLILLAPQSQKSSWDLVRGSFGPDVRLLDTALARVLESHPVDPGHLAVTGFSDGASYALSLGIGNGDLFTHVVAWSPGFAAPRERNGDPRIFVSHGSRDQVLAIDRCSRRLVPALRSKGYAVDYQEFNGGHEVPPKVLDRSLRWFLGPVLERCPSVVE